MAHSRLKAKRVQPLPAAASEQAAANRTVRKMTPMAERDERLSDFDRLCERRFDYRSDAEWDAYYECMAPYLTDADRRVRWRALERLCMAAMRAEPMSYWQREPRG